MKQRRCEQTTQGTLHVCRSLKAKDGCARTRPALVVGRGRLGPLRGGQGSGRVGKGTAYTHTHTHTDAHQLGKEGILSIVFVVSFFPPLLCYLSRLSSLFTCEKLR